MEGLHASKLSKWWPPLKNMVPKYLFSVTATTMMLMSKTFITYPISENLEQIFLMNNMNWPQNLNGNKLPQMVTSALSG